MPILVIGATGTNGRHVVRGLLHAGQPVRALVRDAAKARLALTSKVDRFPRHTR